MNEQQRKFCEYVAQGNAAYNACLKAGYTESYSKTFSHKLLEKYKNEIETLKPIMQKAIEKKFSYSVEKSFNKLNEIQELALLPNEKGDYCNLASAIKAEELKGKMYGVYEADNSQKGYSVIINREAVHIDGNQV